MEELLSESRTEESGCRLRELLLITLFVLALAVPATRVFHEQMVPPETIRGPNTRVTPDLPRPASTPIPTATPVLVVTPVHFLPPTPGPTTTPYAAALQNPRFGIAWSSSFYNSQRVSLLTGKAIEAGATWDRWPIPWPVVEPDADGHFRWVYEDLNFFLAATRDRPRYFETQAEDPSLKILAVLTGIPEEYKVVQEGRITGIAGLEEPVFLASREINPANRWGQFVYQVSSTFGTVVDAWEIGNENELPLPPPAYARAMEVACQVLATTDPTGEVLLGAPEHLIALRTARGEQTNYRTLLEILAAKVRSSDNLHTCIGGLALHVYERPTHSHYIISRIADLTSDLGWQPEVWITETGVQHPDRDDPRRPDPALCRETSFPCVSDVEQASYLIQQYALAMQALAQKDREGVVIYHRLKDEFDRDPHPEVNDGPWGLMDLENRLLPAYRAARLTSAMLGGARYLREEAEDDPTCRHLLFADPARRLVHVLWATTSQTVTVNVPVCPGRTICYQQDLSPCPDEFWSSEDTLNLTLPGATTRERGDARDIFYPAPIVGGKTFILIQQPCSGGAYHIQ